MNWDINVWQGLVAGVAAMVPGAIIYHPKVLGATWAKEVGHKVGQMDGAGAAMAKMLVASLLNGVVASLVVRTIGAQNVGDAVLVGLVLSWFWVSGSLMQTFFEPNRSWKLFQINALSHVLTGAVIGLVLGLFL